MGDDMDEKRNTLSYIDSPLQQYNDYPDQDNVEPTDGRPSILITFQNSASYYTSYMGGQGGRAQGGRRKYSDPNEGAIQPNNHPIVVMNEYPNPGPVLVAVNSRKSSCDRNYNPFLNPSLSNGPPCPPGPPGPTGPPGPPAPNLPSSRRGSISINSNTLELPKRRRASMTPGIASASARGRNSPTERLMNSSNRRTPTPNFLSLSRPSTRLGTPDTYTLPRGNKLRPPRNSRSMPTLNEFADCSIEEPQDILDISPRPSVCSSAMTESQNEQRPLVPDNLSQRDEDDNSWVPNQKPNWLSLNLDEERDKPRARARSVYVAEIWPSLVCLLTAVLVTLTIYLLISYLYTQPIPSQTRNRILPARPAYPPPQNPYEYSAGYPMNYPYNPGPYERFPPPHPQNLPPPPDP